MPPEEQAVHIDGPAGLAVVDHILDALDALWLTAAHVPAEDRTLFTLAVSEVATNMVQHVGDVDPAHITLSVDIAVTTSELRAVLTDTAPPASIDWHGVSMPDADSESGRGLALTQAALDEVAHHYDDRGNTWMLRRLLGVTR